MNISKIEQRVLQVLAQRGAIHPDPDRDGPKIRGIVCVARDGHVLADCALDVFSRLRRRSLIGSHGGGPCRITHLGRRPVRSQPDNR